MLILAGYLVPAERSARADVQGASRYFDPTADDNPDSDQTFLANADLSKLCRNCRKPGHTSFQCPHVIVRSLSCPPIVRQRILLSEASRESVY